MAAIAAYFILINLTNLLQPSLPIPVVSIAGNWAGYVVASQIFNPQPAVQNVSASWVVPQVMDVGADAYLSVWIGIGGQFDQTLIQVGTEQDFTNGQAKYYAWYEMLPNNSVPIESMQIARRPNTSIH